jgi:SAM-dependent methyltransferase
MKQSTNDSGLDYGAGTGPVITKMLREKGYQIETYDPFFNPRKEALKKTYDYIVCCEVIEHFHNPVEEFEGLKNILKNGGTLYCMTQLYDSSIHFKTWNYKDDETHVIIYHRKGMEYIQKRFGFSSLEINNRLILLFD